jgi:glucose-6-phosphate isomerase
VPGEEKSKNAGEGTEKMAELLFNYDNALFSKVGKDGIAVGDIDAKAGKAALAAFRPRVEDGTIGFPLMPDATKAAAEIMAYADTLRGEVDHILLVGIGGSALGAYALDIALRGPHPIQTPWGGAKKAAPQMVVLDNVDPGVVAAALENLDPKRTAIVVIAKSGGTAETLSTFLIAYEWLQHGTPKGMPGKHSGLSKSKARQRVIAVTDEHKGDLLAAAKQEKWKTFFVPGNVGGRFSVFSPVGLVPAALAGFDIVKLLKGAKKANKACWSEDLTVNKALASALIHYALDVKKGKKTEVVFSYSSYLWGSAFWYRQLWAESLGKRVDRQGKVIECGQTPVAALGVTDQHSQVQLYIEGPRDKMFTFWSVAKPRVDLKIPKEFSHLDAFGFLGGKKLNQLFEAERIATQAALAEYGRPSISWVLPSLDEFAIGEFFQTMEFQTAFAGELYGIDAFDQPGVELGKKLTYGLLGRKGFEEYAARFPKSK